MGTTIFVSSKNRPESLLFNTLLQAFVFHLFEGLITRYMMNYYDDKVIKYNYINDFY